MLLGLLDKMFNIGVFADKNKKRKNVYTSGLRRLPTLLIAPLQVLAIGRMTQ